MFGAAPLKHLSTGCLLGAFCVPVTWAVDSDRHELGFVVNSLSLPVYTDQTDVRAHYSFRFSEPEQGIMARGLEDHLQGISRLTLDAGWSWRGFDDVIGEESGDGPSGRVEFLYSSLSLPLHVEAHYEMLVGEMDDESEMTRDIYGGEVGFRFGESVLYGSYNLDQYSYDLVVFNISRDLDYDITDYGLNLRWLRPVDENFHQLWFSARAYELDADNTSFDWYEARIAYDYYPGLVGCIGINLRGMYSDDVEDLDGIAAGIRVEAYPGYTGIVRGWIEYFVPLNEQGDDGYSASLEWVWTF